MSKSLFRINTPRIRRFLALFLVMTLVGLSCYLLGLSAGRSRNTIPPIIYMKSPTTTLPALPLGGEVVAHQGKDLYWGPWCKEAWDVAGDRQIWLPNEEYALQKGYKPAKTCKGLQHIQQ